MKYFLRLGADYLEDAKPYRSKAAAIAAFEATARELDRYGQAIDASIYIGSTHQRVPLTEYPDFVLSLGPRGGLVCECA